MHRISHLLALPLADPHVVLASIQKETSGSATSNSLEKFGSTMQQTEELIFNAPQHFAFPSLHHFLPESLFSLRGKCHSGCWQRSPVAHLHSPLGEQGARPSTSLHKLPNSVRCWLKRDGRWPKPT